MPKKAKEKKEAPADTGPPPEDPEGQAIMHSAELASKRASVDHYRAECERLRKINHKLKQEMFEREKSSFEVIDTWRKKVDEQKQGNVSLSQKMEEMQESTHKERVFAEEVFEAKIKVLEDELEHTETKMAQENMKLTEKVNNLTEFAEKQEILEKELEALTIEKKDLEEQQSETVVKMERKFIEEKARLQKDINKKLVAFKKASEEKVNENLDASTKRILMQNRQMADELRLHVQETNELLKTKSRLVSESKRLARESDLQKQEVSEFGSRCASQQRQIKEQAEKIKNLERSLSKVVHEFEAERRRWESSVGAEASSQAKTIESLAQQNRAKDRELKTLRRLAKDILRQRSDVEQFFLDSLEYVKEQALAERQQQKRQFDAQYLRQVRDATLRKGVAFPSIRRHSGEVMGVGESRLPTEPDQKVDLTQLTWEDREQVLRLLFAKINHAQQQQQRATSAPATRESSYGDGTMSGTDRTVFGNDGDVIDVMSMSGPVEAFEGLTSAARPGLS